MYLFPVLTACCRDGRKNSAQRLLLLDAVDRGNDDLAALLARRCNCDVIRSRDVTSPSYCTRDVAGVVLIHSPIARQLYDDMRHHGLSSSVDVFTAVFSDLVSQWHHCRDAASLTPVYHVCYLDGIRLDNNSHIIQ